MELPTQSQSIGQLAEALAEAQGQMKPAVKDSVNPFFKSHYADLASCIAAATPALSKFKLSVVQTTQPIEGQLYVVTTLAHMSGEWIKGYFPVAAKDGTPQAIGSATTYARRFAYSAIIGQSASDDDAEEAQPRTQNTKTTQSQPSKQKPDIRVDRGPNPCTEAQLRLINFQFEKGKIPLGKRIEILKTVAGVSVAERIPFDKVPDVLGAIQKAEKGATNAVTAQ